MEPRLSFITLGVSDLNAARRFYREKFGWTPLLDNGGIIFFKLNGFILSLFPANELAEDAGVPEDGKGFKRFTLAICLRSEAEVDQTFEKLGLKGVHVVKRPQKTEWGGYSGYVEDIDHNLWEIAFNPFLQMDETGNIIG